MDCKYSRRGFYSLIRLSNCFEALSSRELRPRSGSRPAVRARATSGLGLGDSHAVTSLLRLKATGLAASVLGIAVLVFSCEELSF